MVREVRAYSSKQVQPQFSCNAQEIKKMEPFDPKSKLGNSKETNQQDLQKQSSTNVDKHMTSVILPPSIQTRLKIQRKFIHQKDNRNQGGVYSKHTWKHFLSVRKSPLVFFLLPSSSLENFSLCPHNPKNPSVFLPFSRIYISLPKEPPKSTGGKSPPLFLF